MMPETLDDAVLGRLQWEADMGWWAGILRLADGETPEVFVFQPEPEDDPGAALARARRGLGRLMEDEPAYRRVAASTLLDLAHQIPGDGPGPGTAFAEHLRAESVEFRADGSFVIHYTDGRLVPGLAIALPVAADGTLGRPRLEG